MTPRIPKTDKAIAAETHIEQCPICKAAMDSAESAICEEGFRLLQEAMRTGQIRLDRQEN